LLVPEQEDYSDGQLCRAGNAVHFGDFLFVGGKYSRADHETSIEILNGRKQWMALQTP
jgi:hypothetical protein